MYSLTSVWQTAKDNVTFVLVVLGIAALIFIAAYLVERAEVRGRNEKILTTKKIAVIGMFSAIAAVLMFFEFPIWFAPSFYELDFSEVPVLICAFAFGPVAGAMAEFCKVLLKLVLKGTTTAFVGDFANFVIGCSFILPSAIIYKYKKNRKNAIVSVAVGTMCMTIFGSLFNAVYLLPKFAQLFGLPLDQIIAMGSAINGAINSVSTLVLFAVVPMNLLKGGAVSLITILIYKKISIILKGVK